MYDELISLRVATFFQPVSLVSGVVVIIQSLWNANDMLNDLPSKKKSFEQPLGFHMAFKEVQDILWTRLADKYGGVPFVTVHKI